MSNPTPFNPVRINPLELACGHNAAPGQPEGHNVCPACYTKQKARDVVAFERLHEIDVKIKGPPKAANYARSIRYRVLDKLYARISAEGELPFLMEYVREFRKQEQAQWFINRRFFSVDKLKRSKGFSAAKSGGSYVDAFAEAEAEIGGVK